MTRGVLIFAFSNEKIDYLEQAVWIADRVNIHLDLPVTIITDVKSINGRKFKHNLVLSDAISGGRRNFKHLEEGNIGTWYNSNRFQSYNLTPYDETLVIDSDYVVSSNQLLKVFETKYNVLCHRDVYDITGRNGFAPYYTFGKHKFPHYWATVLFFRKSKQAEEMFQLMTMIKDNYRHYSNLYKFRERPFRNDFVVSMALGILYGHKLDAIPSIPWAMPSAYDDVDLEQLDDTKFKISYTKYIKGSKKPYKSIISDTDFHFINKFALDKVIHA
jgi:hypothetical protein